MEGKDSPTAIALVWNNDNSKVVGFISVTREFHELLLAEAEVVLSPVLTNGDSKKLHCVSVRPLEASPE